MKKFKWHIFFLLLFILNKPLFAQFTTPEQTIVSGIYTFIINTEWKNENTFKIFTIGVLEKDSSFYKQCVEKYEGIRIKNCPVKIQLYNSVDAVDNCQVLYVNKKFNKNIGEIAKKNQGNNTLLITNSCKNNRVTMINYNNILKKKEFEINDENIKQAGLKLSSRFFDFAEDKISWQELYMQSSSSLEKEIEKVYQQQLTIANQKSEISFQKLSLSEKQKLLSEQEMGILHQREILSLQQAEIESHQKEIEVHQKEIEKQKVVLIKQLGEIEKQRVILILLGLVLIMTAITIIVAFRSYKLKKTANRKLEEKNNAILKQKELLLEVNAELFKLSIVARETDNSIVISDKNGNFEWANDGFTRLFGFTFSEFIELKGGNIISASSNPNVRDAVNECLQKKKSVIYVMPTHTKSGNIIWIQTTLTPVIDENGEIYKLVAIDADVSKIKWAEEEIKLQKTLIEDEKMKSDKLLLNILPAETAEELKITGRAIPRYYEKVSVLFTDFKGFTKSSEALSPNELAKELNRYFVKFDEITDKYNIEKIKTIGDAYMCAGGLPTSNNRHFFDIVFAGLEIQQFMHELNECKINSGIPIWELRLGIHTGEVITGVVGKRKFAYDIWGDTVNVASRMESSCENGKINISGAAYEFVKDFFEFSFRGKISAKNKSDMDMYFVESEL